MKEKLNNLLQRPEIKYWVHAKTYEEAQEIIAKFKSMGYFWRYGPTTKERLYWFDNAECTCYGIESGYIVCGRTSPTREIKGLKEFLKLSKKF